MLLLLNVGMILIWTERAKEKFREPLVRRTIRTFGSVARSLMMLLDKIVVATA
jgi:hypothetical protein